SKSRREHMTIWDNYPKYTEDEFRLLVRSTAMTLFDQSDENDQLDLEFLEAGSRETARQLSQLLSSNDMIYRPEQFQRLLANPSEARAACLTVLDEIRKYPQLANQVAEAYEDQRYKMAGIEVLLAGALL